MYSNISMTRFPMTPLPWLIWTGFWVPKNSIRYVVQEGYFREIFWFHHENVYSRLSLSRTCLSRITAYLEVKIWSLLNTEIYQQATKYWGKEEKLQLRSNFSSFPQYFQYISNLGVKIKINFVKGGCWINCFPQFRKSDMSKYGYLEVFL